MSEPTVTAIDPDKTRPVELPPRPARLQVEVRGLQRQPWRDVYPFLLATTWPRLLGLIALLYLAINALFAAGYWLDPGGIENAAPGSYRDAFFFSIETFGTIGYGKMAPVHTQAHLLVTAESLLSLLSTAMITGLIFAKFSRPTARVMFSKAAVVTTWDGKRSLLFRLANERGTQIVDAQISVTLNRLEATSDGGSIRRYHDLALTRDRNPNFLFAWTVIHPIDERSPLFGTSTEDLLAQDAIIGVSMVGIDEVFNQTVYARHTYSAHDLRWGHDFRPILGRGQDGRRVIDYTHFHETDPEEPAEASARAG